MLIGRTRPVSEAEWLACGRRGLGGDLLLVNREDLFAGVYLGLPTIMGFQETLGLSTTPQEDLNAPRDAPSRECQLELDSQRTVRSLHVGANRRETG